MRKRVVHGEGVWRTNELQPVKPRARAEYASLIPLALANRAFVANPDRILADVHRYNQPVITVESVEIIKQTLKTRTTRLDVAAILLVRGFEICDVKLDGSAGTFAFKDPNLNGAAAAKNFYKGTQVPPNAYADAQKRVRGLMCEAKRLGVL